MICQSPIGKKSFDLSQEATFFLRNDDSQNWLFFVKIL